MAGMSRKERKEYEELKKRKKRQMERREQYARRNVYDEDFGDIYCEEPVRRVRRPEDLDGRYERDRKHYREPKAGRKKKRKQRGKTTALIQACTSIAFIGFALYLGMIPWLYLGIIVAVLVLLLYLFLKMQNGRKAKPFAGKCLGMLLSIALVLGCYYMFDVRQMLGKISSKGETISKDSGNIDVSKEPFSVYISGIDVYGEITAESRSDVNIIATVNPNTKEVLLTTTPRDYYVEIPGVSNGYKDKLTHAGTYGVASSVATLEQLYEVEIPFYVRVNFTSLIEMVDILGGIDVKSDLAFTTGPESGCIVEVKEGINHFDGKQALAFARERHSLADGDNQRGKNQQKIIEALIDKAASPIILLKLPQLLDKAGEYTDTNMATSQIQELARAQLTGLGGWKVHSLAAEGTGKKAYCYSYSGGSLYVTVPDETSVANIKDAMNRIEAGEKIE